MSVDEGSATSMQPNSKGKNLPMVYNSYKEVFFLQGEKDVSIRLKEQAKHNQSFYLPYRLQE